ncbi:MAG: hypothetical protein ACREEZ_14525 [Stellaceae bacterium]
MSGSRANRLLSPNEAKFWLLDWAAPMNSIAVIERAEGASPVAVAPPRRFALPVVCVGRQSRPRWGAATMPGMIERESMASEWDWLAAAERLQGVRVGSAGHPPWHAVIQQHTQGTTLVFAVNHALTDWRTCLHVARSFLADADPGDLAPACEELLPSNCFADPAAASLLDGWWTSRAGARWEALGLARLAQAFPPPAISRFAVEHLTLDVTARLARRCETEGVSLNSALAITLRDVMPPLDSVAHSVDMHRFIRPPPAPGPGLAVAHVFTPLAAGAFWEAARDNRAALFEAIRGGGAGDALLQLPRVLLGRMPPREAAAMTITGAPTVGTRNGADANQDMELVLSSARGGGGILILSRRRGALQLVAGAPAGGPEVPLPAIVERLAAAVA